jgi:hypothetical protein
MNGNKKISGILKGLSLKNFTKSGGGEYQVSIG